VAGRQAANGSWSLADTCIVVRTWADVPLKDIADLILRVNVGGYSLEMANPRHEHEWRVWETVKLPEGKVLLPGVISHATNVVEHPNWSPSDWYDWRNWLVRSV
jgi:methionine synthase II (cobalamin-independent)